MSFRDIPNIKLSYNSLEDNIVSEFYIPCLKQAREYKRAVGFFSSSILLELSQGIGSLADRKGKMKLLVSPRLDKEDYDAIAEGYDIREKIQTQVVNDFMSDFDSDFDQKTDRYEMLSYMVATGLLEIKIVILRDLKSNEYAMFHRKTGIFRDEVGNAISFIGSGNESENAMHINDEEYDVYCSWINETDELRCVEKETSFDTVWNGNSKHLISIPFPEVIKEKILQYKSDGDKHFVDIDINYENRHSYHETRHNKPLMKETIKLYDHQSEAVENWKKQNYRGVFDMATGAGKTYAAGYAICQLYKDKKRLFVIICCPQTHLVEQWGEELKNFNITPILYYGETKNFKAVEREAGDFKRHYSNFGCIVTTNDSFQKENFQKIVDEVIKEALIIVDEAHNFGANKISRFLELDFPYRLALSATFERHRDTAGTQKLTNFFGPRCIEYTLKKAIEDGNLCRYYYYPVVTYLLPDEYDKYVSLTAKAMTHSQDGVIDSVGELILIQRARIVAGAENKIGLLEQVIKPYRNKEGNLVYCGTNSYDDGETDERQVERVAKLLNTELRMNAVTFTSEDDRQTRQQIIREFKSGFYNAIVAIKCLDEGIDIPAIKTAFILASTTNPREYIQRRGRVLRKYPGKQFAEIYDFITLPFKKGTYHYQSGKNLTTDQGLVMRELERMHEFAELSENPSAYINLMNEIQSEYEIDTINVKEDDIYV